MLKELNCIKRNCHSISLVPVQLPLSLQMRYIVSDLLLHKFCEIAARNICVNGKLKETLAYIAGYEEDKELLGTHLIFPLQNGTSTSVDDQGKS